MQLRHFQKTEFGPHQSPSFEPNHTAQTSYYNRRRALTYSSHSYGRLPYNQGPPDDYNFYECNSNYQNKRRAKTIFNHFSNHDDSSREWRISQPLNSYCTGDRPRAHQQYLHQAHRQGQAPNYHNYGGKRRAPDALMPPQLRNFENSFDNSEVTGSFLEKSDQGQSNSDSLQRTSDCLLYTSDA